MQELPDRGSSVLRTGQLRAPRAAWLACVMALSVFLFSSCSTEGERPLRVGTNVWPGYETLYLARSLGEYRDTDIKLVELPNASEVIQALRNGTLEVAALTLDEALSVAQDGHDLRVVSIMDFSRGGDVVLAQSGITEAADLRGRRIGVENTAVGAIMLDAVLRSANLQLDDVEAIPITVDEHAEAFVSGRVDAIVTFEPVRSKLLAVGAEPLFDSSFIPDRIVDVLVTRADVAERHAVNLRSLLRGHFTAQAYLRDHPDAAAALIEARVGLPEAALGPMFRGIYLPDLVENHRLLTPGPAGLEPVLHDLIELMRDRGLLHSVPDTSAMLTSAWLPEKG